MDLWFALIKKGATDLLCQLVNIKHGLNFGGAGMIARITLAYQPNKKGAFAPFFTFYHQLQHLANQPNQCQMLLLRLTFQG